jgi:hypothetical protein
MVQIIGAIEVPAGAQQDDVTLDQLRELIASGGGGGGGPHAATHLPAGSDPLVLPWGAVSEKPTVFPPEAHAHPVADVTGLQALLDAKAPLSHAHTIADVTALQAALDAKAALAHIHAQADVTNLTADLAAKQATSQKGQANGYASLDATGKVPPGQLPASAGFTWEAVVRQAADVAVAGTTLVNTDLVFTFVANGVYLIDLFLLAQAAATTTGFGYAFDTSVAVTTVALTFVHTLANTGTVSGGQSRADATATGLSSGVDTINVPVFVNGKGILVAGGTGGTARLQARSEVAAASTFKANSVMRVHRVA